MQNRKSSQVVQMLGSSLCVASIVFTVAACSAPKSQFKALPEATPPQFASQSTDPVDAPRAAEDVGPFEMAEGTSVRIEKVKLLKPELSAPGQGLEWVSQREPSNGTLEEDGDSVTFTPKHGFVGKVKFTYVAKDKQGRISTGVVTVEVRRPAAEPVYGSSGSKLYRYDLASAGSVEIGKFTIDGASVDNVFDTAISSDGLMYAVAGNALYYVDANSAKMTLVTADGLASFKTIAGLTALPSGQLALAGDGISLYDITTKKLTTLVAPGQYETSGDIVALPDGFLYWVVKTDGNNHLIRVNPKTAALVDVGSLGRDSIFGLGYAEGNLYGFAKNGDVFPINPETAAVGQSSRSEIFWYGATTNPVRW
ncbi:MAG: cadherin-like domain-containing protein [Methylotenera sp.]|nr:cadherin-like domain-containing protein [Oligoflexia bacterium]